MAAAVSRQPLPAKAFRERGQQSRIAETRTNLFHYEKLRDALRVSLKRDPINLKIHRALALVAGEIWCAVADLCRMAGEKILLD